ncbi:MAG: polyhydroxyalkanoate synthesis regulator DNA-binding domain-containing protein [Deltaproteobacteria bacterium]|nr:polyhydroxyalkanoate synthesis regulator DNA-binding domain-containing protein [Deltaproteobacteria bacterium]
MGRKIVIKKYPNRKLYNTDSASYISYKDIVEMIKAGDSVTVVDNRTKQDITRFTLTQILFQKEREFLKSLPESTLETAIKQEEGLLSNSITSLASFGTGASNAATAGTTTNTAATANN